MPGGTVQIVSARGESVNAVVAGPPERGGGVGGWQSSERSRRRPAKWWRALPDDTYTWELIFDLDAHPADGPIEARLKTLRNMGQPLDDDEPPTIHVYGDIWDNDALIRWVIDGMTLGDRITMPNADGTAMALRQQRVNLALSRGDTVAEIEPVRIKRTRGTKGKKRRRTVKTRQGDTLRAVALRELGDGSRWKDLRKWNKTLAKVNPDARLRAGLNVTLR